MIQVTDTVAIAESELQFQASRSGGPGGQNVNKVNTRVMVLFDVANSPTLSEDNKALILKRLSTRINKEGVLRVVSQKYRSQERNRDAAVERLVELLQGALKRSKRRKKTKIPTEAKEARLKKKKQRSKVKQLRSKKSIMKDEV